MAPNPHLAEPATKTDFGNRKNWSAWLLRFREAVFSIRLIQYDSGSRFLRFVFDDGIAALVGNSAMQRSVIGIYRTNWQSRLRPFGKYADRIATSLAAFRLQRPNACFLGGIGTSGKIQFCMW